MPMPVMASSDTEVVESLLDSGIDFLASDPGKAVDIIMYAKDLVDQQNITDDQVRSAVTQAADHFGVSLSDSEVDSLVSVVRKVLDAKIDEDALRSDVNSVYSKLRGYGCYKDDDQRSCVEVNRICKRIIRMRNVKCAKCITLPN